MTSNTFVLSLLKIKGWGKARVVDYIKDNSFNLESCISNLKYALTGNELEFFHEISKAVEGEIAFNKNKGINLVTLFDSVFPKKLYESTQKCCYLFYEGNINLLNSNSVGIIGTRKPSEKLADDGYEMSLLLSKHFTIVSGLALGCDTIAHKACLIAGGKTIAVLPSACDNIQPSSNKELAMSIVKNGGLLISEYPTGTEYNKSNYVERDRLQSLLTNYLFVIETNEKSGTMIAVRKSIKDGKTVYALKGNKVSEIQSYITVDELPEIIKNLKFGGEETKLVQMKLF